MSPRDSATRVFNQSDDNIASGREESDETELNLWFHVNDEIEATEEVAGLGKYGKTLTVITADVPDSDGDSDDGSWRSPQFRY